MTSEERIISLHRRMDILQGRREQQERKKTTLLGAGCGTLAVCLILLGFHEGAGNSGGTATLYTGAAMLFENAGGYVTTAVAAFMAGMIVTVICIRNRQRHEQNKVNMENDRRGREE